MFRLGCLDLAKWTKLDRLHILLHERLKQMRDA